MSAWLFNDPPPKTSTAGGTSITVAREDEHEREVWRWSLSGPELQATGIALTEAEAWRQARAAAGEKAA